MADFDSLMYNWHYGVQPRTAKLGFSPAQVCILKDFVVVLDSSFENLFIFNRSTMQLESQIGTGICDMTVNIHSISENKANLMVLVSESLVQMLNLDSIHMESVNSVFEFSFVEIKCREGSIASLWTDRNAASYLVLWVSYKDNPLMYELFDDDSPKISFDRLEWVTSDRILLVRASSVPVCFSVFSLESRSFLRHVVMNIGRGPQHFAISSNNRRLVMCQDSNFIVYDTADLRRVLCCECDIASDAMDFMALFQNNFLSVGLLGDHRVARYYINEEYCSVDRVSEGRVSFENYDRFKSVSAIGDEVLVVRCTSRDQRSVVLGLLNHFDGNVFQFLKLRLGDVLTLTQSCLVTYSKKTATDRHYEMALFDFTSPLTEDDLWPRLKQKMSEVRKHKKALQDYTLSKQRHVQQLMRAKMLELNRNHLVELKRIAKNPVYMFKGTAQEDSLQLSKPGHQSSPVCLGQTEQDPEDIQQSQQLPTSQQKQQQPHQQTQHQLHAIWQSYYQSRGSGVRDGDTTGAGPVVNMMAAAAATQQQISVNNSGVSGCETPTQQQRQQKRRERGDRVRGQKK